MSTLPQDIRKTLETLASIHTLVATVPPPQSAQPAAHRPDPATLARHVETLRRRLAITAGLITTP